MLQHDQRVSRHEGFSEGLLLFEKGRKKNIEEPCLNTKIHPWFDARQVVPSSSGSLMVNF